jgi:thioredoxin 1
MVGIFAVLNGMLAFKYFRTQQQMAVFADDSVIGQGKPVLLELGSHACVPCKKMIPILTELNKEQTDFVVSFVDVWEDKDKGKRYDIELIPTQIFFDRDGNELFRHTGFFGKEEILAKWDELKTEK